DSRRQRHVPRDAAERDDHVAQIDTLRVHVPRRDAVGGVLDHGSRIWLRRDRDGIERLDLLRRIRRIRKVNRGAGWRANADDDTKWIADADGMRRDVDAGLALDLLPACTRHEPAR